MGTIGWNRDADRALFGQDNRRLAMLKGGLLWLIGIPIPIIILLWLFGVF